MQAATNPVFCALDTPSLDQAVTWATAVQDHVGGLKLGLEFFTAQGPAGVRRIGEFGLPIFLDLKLHDIPATVAGAVRSVAGLGVRFLTIHAGGGPAMLAAAADAADGHDLRLLGVTVMTSIDRSDLVAVGQDPDADAQVERLARLSVANGLDGIVCAATEVRAMRALLPDENVLMVPGIRPAGAAHGDQKRVLGPAEAVQAGATYLVVGRPITTAADPGAAAKAITDELAGGVPA